MNTTERERLRDRLNELNSISLLDVYADEVDSLTAVSIDKSVKPEKRIESLIDQVGNPYIYRDGSMIVKISFANNGKTLQSCMEDYLESELSVRMQNNRI